MPARKSGRIANLSQSYIRSMTRECERVGGINLGQGVCDLPTPVEVLAGAARAIAADLSTYSRPEGILDLRRAIARKMADYNNLHQVNPETDVVVSCGATGAFNAAIHALFNPGDEFIVFEPYYGYHVNSLRVAGFHPVLVTLSPPAWELTAEMLEAAWTNRTRAIVVNTPMNPAGKVFSTHELSLIADFCQAHDLIALTDEIYEYMVFDGRPHVSLASLPGMWERTVTISGFSKTFAITGWRLGYAVAPAHFSEGIALVNDLFYVCAPTPLQHGVAQAMAVMDRAYYRDMAIEYQEKRDMFCTALAAAGLPPHLPQGAYYVLADIRSLGQENDVAAALYLLAKTGVASVPGSAFFNTRAGAGLTRFCFAKEWSVLKEACERLGRLHH